MEAPADCWNWDEWRLKEYEWKGSFPGGGGGFDVLVVPVQEIDFCSALATLVGPVRNIFFLTVHYFNSFIPNSRAGSPSLSMCLWVKYGMLGYYIENHPLYYSISFFTLYNIFLAKSKPETLLEQIVSLMLRKVLPSASSFFDKCTFKV
jgi:hypothetical protein